MRAWNYCQQFTLILGTIALVLPLPQVAMATEPLPTLGVADQAAAPTIIDVQLDSHHRLAGQVLDEAGQPVPQAIVAVASYDGAAQNTTTDSSGAFQVAIERGGVYQVYLGETITVCRVWSPGAAPPHAHDSVLVVTGDVARARCSPLLPVNPMAQFIANPWVITGVVIAAVVIPIAIHNNRRDRDSSS